MQLIEDFGPSDLLYGETGDRKLYLDALDKKFGSKPGQEKPLTIDRLTSSYQVTKGLKSGTAWDGVQKEVEQGNQGLPPEHHVHLPADVQPFYEFAQRHPKFGPKLVGQAQLSLAKANLRAQKDKEGQVPMRKGHDETKPFIRSKCKAGIAFVVAQGFTIRFVLDSLDEKRLKAIFHKEFEQPWYTGSELRSVYRNREAYGQQIVFYRKGERCQPPWVAFPNIIPEGGVPGTRFVDKQ